MSITTQKVVNMILKGLRGKQEATQRAVSMLSKQLDAGTINVDEAKALLVMLEEFDTNTKQEIATVKKLAKM